MKIFGLVVGEVDGNNAGLVLFVFSDFCPTNAFRGGKIFRFEVDFVIFVGQVAFRVRFLNGEVVVVFCTGSILKHAVGNRRNVKAVFLAVQLKNAVWAFNQTAGRSSRQGRKQRRVIARWGKVIIFARNRHLNRALGQISGQLA